MPAHCPAAGILDAALARRYRLPPRTRGLRAGLVVAAPDASAHRGRLHVGCSRHVAVVLPDAPPPVVRWVRHELLRWAQGHLHRSFAASEGRYQVHVHRLSDGTRLARLADEATGAWFRLRDGRVVAAGRSMGETAVLTTPVAWRRLDDGRELLVDELVECRDLVDDRVLRTEKRTTTYGDAAPYLPTRHTVRVTDDTGTRAWSVGFERPAILLATPEGTQAVEPGG